MSKRKEKLVAYKGFDKDLRCRGYQFEVGKTYKEQTAKLCESGFHACEHPLDVFKYYPPASGRFAEVELSDLSPETKNDTKRVGKTIHIKAEIGIKGMIEAAIKFVFDRVDFSKAAEDTASGVRGAAQASGDQGAAQASGYQGAATAGHPEAIAMAAGIDSKARGVLGSWIVLSEWEGLPDAWHRKDVQAVRVDGETIKADVFYQLRDGKIVEE